jgi:hypothetical protein
MADVSDDATRSKVAKRLTDLVALSKHNAVLLVKKARTWRVIGVALGLVAAGLAAAAGATGLAETLSKESVAYLALASAVVTALNSGLGAIGTAEVEQKAALEFRKLEDDADLWQELHLPTTASADAIAKLEEFVKRRNDILATTTACAYYLARRDGRKMRHEAEVVDQSQS